MMGAQGEAGLMRKNPYSKKCCDNGDRLRQSNAKSGRPADNWPSGKIVAAHHNAMW